MASFDEIARAAREAERLVAQNRSVIEMAKSLSRVPALAAINAIHENSAVKQLLEAVVQQRALSRSAQAPLAELRLAGIFEPSSAAFSEFQFAQQMLDNYRARFTLPEVNTALALIKKLPLDPIAKVAAQYAQQAKEIENAVQAMHVPWLDAQQALRSITSFTQIQGIGSMLLHAPTFNDQVTDALRTNLGDWRDKISWPDPVLTDLNARSDFYVGLGFDPAITDFPASAFQECTEIAGLRREPPLIVAEYGEPIPSSLDDDEEKGLIRTNTAHDWLQRLENSLRRFIDVQMTSAFGQDWPKYRLPNGLYDKWKEKQENAKKSGRAPQALIAYADFTDYERVICRQDNWREVFSAFFGRPESIRESFQRLCLIRLDTMHARPIGQDDELLLYVEVKRLVRVIVG